MNLDFLNEFGADEAVAGAAATRNVGDVIDLLATVGGDVGSYPPIYWYVKIDTAPAGATSVEFKLVTDSTGIPATDGSATQLVSTGAIAIASLPAGTVLAFPLPHGIVSERYLGLQCTNVGATALSALVVTSGLTLTPPAWRAYPEGAN